MGDVGAVGRSGERGEEEEGAGRVLAGGEEDEVAFIYKSDVWFLAKEQNGQVACVVNMEKRVVGSRTGTSKRSLVFVE